MSEEQIKVFPQVAEQEIESGDFGVSEIEFSCEVVDEISVSA